jgi:hypothetical protein
MMYCEVAYLHTKFPDRGGEVLDLVVRDYPRSGASRFFFPKWSGHDVATIIPRSLFGCGAYRSAGNRVLELFQQLRLRW